MRVELIVIDEDWHPMPETGMSLEERIFWLQVYMEDVEKFNSTRIRGHE